VETVVVWIVEVVEIVVVVNGGRVTVSVFDVVV